VPAHQHSILAACLAFGVLCLVQQQPGLAQDSTYPYVALWKSIKRELIGPDGASYFESSLRDAMLPTIRGKVVQLEPAVKPKNVMLAIEDGKTADATLKFNLPLPGKVEPGTELSFEGIPESYTATPFMVVFAVEKDNLHGWTGKNAPPPVRKRPAAANKK
jgi:hypothetical protein